MNLHPIFAECVASPDEEMRYALKAPFVRGGFVYATDGRICVRAKSDAPDTEGQFPDTAGLGWNRDTSVVIALPEQLPEQPVNKCTGCKGNGFVQCDFGHEHSCEDCDGKGNVRPTVRVKVGESDINLRWASILKRHGCVLYKPAKPTAPIYFTFDGGDGIVMPMLPETP